MFRKFSVVALLILVLSGWAAAADRDAAVKIMTQNMDDGTDQTYLVGALTGVLPGFTVPDAVDLTFQELQATNFPDRAGLIAARIAESRPDLVALQEATLWRTGSSTATATTILYDQLALLLSALRERGVPYDIVAVSSVNDVALPGNNLVGALRFTDRNALLIRSDLRPPAVHLSEVHARIFDAAFDFAGLRIMAGWISVQVHMGNEHFRLVTTHLESPLAGVPQATEVQVAQARELIRALRNSTLPVVLCGDFNSDANGGNFVDATPTARLIQSAGYLEVWPRVHAAGDPGLTWPYYLEDQFPPPPFFAPFEPVERIDLFFSKGITAESAELVVAPSGALPPFFSMPPFGSDHAGVIAVFRP